MSMNLLRLNKTTLTRSGAEMKPKIYNLLEQCVENGTKRGYRRAHKYVESPQEDSILEHIEECIMGELMEWFDFEEFKE
jgi:hypothetical protein